MRDGSQNPMKQKEEIFNFLTVKRWGQMWVEVMEEKLDSTSTCSHPQDSCSVAESSSLFDG